MKCVQFFLDLMISFDSIGVRQPEDTRITNLGTNVVCHRFLTYTTRQYADILCRHEELPTLCGVSKSTIFITCYGLGVAHAWDQSLNFDLQARLFRKGYAFCSFGDVRPAGAKI